MKEEGESQMNMNRLARLARPLAMLVAALLASGALCMGAGAQGNAGFGYGAEAFDVFGVELEALNGRWLDVNSDTTLAFEADQMTVRTGSWTDVYPVHLEKTDYSVTIKDWQARRKYGISRRRRRSRLIPARSGASAWYSATASAAMGWTRIGHPAATAG